MEHPNEPVPLVRIGSTGYGPAIALTVILTALALAVVKPWGNTTPRQTVPAPLPAVGVVRTTPVPLRSPRLRGLTPDPSGGPFGAPDAVPVIVGGLPICYTPDGWRLVTDEESSGRLARSWIAVTVAVASRPTDPRIPQTKVASSGVTGLGFCAPATLRGAGEWHATLWEVRPRVSSVDAESVVRLAVLSASPSAGGAVAPSERATRSGWPPGHYVVEVQEPGPKAPVVAFGIDLTAPSRASAGGTALPDGLPASPLPTR